ncbi:hypothetical protein REPUB_Repub04eG0058600 [Reevesia pubescens]
MEADSTGGPPSGQGGDEVVVKERGAKRDRSVPEDITNTKNLNMLDSNIMKDNGDRDSKVTYKSKLLNQKTAVDEALMEEGEVDLEDYDSDDDFLEDTIEEPCILLSKAEKQRIRSPWRNTLIVKLLGRSIRRRTPGFRSEDATITSVAAWIRFPGMPLEYYDYEILNRMGNLLMQTLMIDRNTLTASRGRYARICAEINLTKPLVLRIFIGGRWQKVEYEGLGMVCFACGRFGHSKEQCLNEKDNEEGAKNKKVKFVEANDQTTSVVNGAEKFGPKSDIEGFKLGLQATAAVSNKVNTNKGGSSSVSSLVQIVKVASSGDKNKKREEMQFSENARTSLTQGNISPRISQDPVTGILQLGRIVKDKPPNIFLDHEMNDVQILENKGVEVRGGSKDV